MALPLPDFLLDIAILGVKSDAGKNLDQGSGKRSRGAKHSQDCMKLSSSVWTSGSFLGQQAWMS